MKSFVLRIAKTFLGSHAGCNRLKISDMFAYIVYLHIYLTKDLLSNRLKPLAWIYGCFDTSLDQNIHNYTVKPV